MSFRELFHWRKPSDKKEVTALSDLRSQIDHLFENFFTDTESGKGLSLFKGDSFKSFSPSISITENEQEYLLKAEMPGLARDDISVEVDGEVLVLSGEKKKEVKSEKDKIHTTEFSYGKFSRRFHLPQDVDKDDILADYNKGVLTLTLRKTPELSQKRKAININ